MAVTYLDNGFSVVPPSVAPDFAAVQADPPTLFGASPVMNFNSTRYRMRGWSASLGHHVEWYAAFIDGLGVNASPGAGALTNIVWLGIV